MPILFLIPPAPTSTAQNLHVTAELRERLERRVNPGFNPTGKNRSDLYSRVRVGLAYAFDPQWSGRVEYQNAHDLVWTGTRNWGTDASDLSLAYVHYAGAHVSVTGGRQKIDLGQQRLIGPSEWLNLARSFDAGRVQFGQWDVWGGRLGVANVKPETARIGVLTHRDPQWGATSLIVKHDVGSTAAIDVQTLDHLLSRTISHVTLDGEVALQTGRNNGRDQRAWALHARASRQVLPKTTLRLEVNSASGGGDANTSRTFDNLYPSNHDLYGLADIVGWRNMNDLALKVECKATDALTVQAEAHAFSLRDPSDAWYSGAGSPNVGATGALIDPTGKSGRDLGKELDFQMSYATKKDGVVTAGIALFKPGNFVQSVSGKSNQFTYGFLQYQIRL